MARTVHCVLLKKDADGKPAALEPDVHHDDEGSNSAWPALHPPANPDELADAAVFIGLSAAVEISGQPKRHPRPDIHQHHTQDDNQHVGHHPRKYLVERDMLGRHTFQVIGGHCDGR